MTELTIGQWTKHANDLIQTGCSMFDNVNNVTVSDKGSSDEKIVSLALLCRTLSNFKSVLLLAQNERLVESRILTRACYENLFYVGAIQKEGYSFVQKMMRADCHHHKSRGQSLLSDAKYIESEDDWRTPLKAYLKRIKENNQPSATINPKDISKNGPIAKQYIIYEQLSADSAHPTTDALNRYFSKTEENGKMIRCLDIEPILNDTDVHQTLNWACNAMLGVIIGVNEILGGSSANQKVLQMFEDRQELEAAAQS